MTLLIHRVEVLKPQSTIVNSQCTQNPCSGHFECNGDVSPVVSSVGQSAHALRGRPQPRRPFSGMSNCAQTHGFRRIRLVDVSCRAVLVGRVATLVAGCLNAPGFACGCLSSGEFVEPSGAEHSRTLHWLTLKPSLFVMEDQRKTLASQRVPGSSDRQLIDCIWPKEFQI